MAGKFNVSWGIFDEYCVEDVETSRFPEVSEVDLDKMKEGLIFCPGEGGGGGLFKYLFFILLYQVGISS